MIQSNPSNAKVYIDDEYVGNTPYYHTDTKIVGSSLYISIEKEGYENFNTVITRDEEADAGAIVGGVFLVFPFLWTLGYKPVHQYELTPLMPYDEEQDITLISATKVEKLRELKQLLDEGIITQEEFEREKKKILDLDN